jgi:hypothetical protein
MGAGRPKGSGGTNKSAAIRDYLKANPTASTNEVMEALGAKGVEVSQALVAGVRAREHRGPGNKSRKGEITVSELSAINVMIEKFDDRDVILGIIEDLGALIKNIGGIDRFEEAMKEYQNWKPSESASISEVSSEVISDDPEDSSEEDDEDDDDDDDEDDD